MENQAILKRLQEKQSNYNVIKWEEQRVQNEKLIEKISEYPIRLYDGYQENERMTIDPSIRSKDNFPSIKRNSNSITRKGKRRFLNTQQDFYTAKQGLSETERNTHTSSQKQNQLIPQDIGGIVNLDSERIVLIKKGRMMTTGYYLVEVSRTETTFHIVAIK